MNLLYILDDQHNPVPVDNVLQWAEWIDTADRHVRLNRLPGDVSVSTVFLGVNPPLLFETMIFGGKLNGRQWRYCTWDEAMAGHEQALNLLMVQ